MVSKNFSDLTNAERFAFWAEVEAEISFLLSALSSRIPRPDHGRILEYLGHNELGLALEHLCDTLIEEEADVAESEYVRISALFEKMKLASSGRLESLASRTRN